MHSVRASSHQVLSFSLPPPIPFSLRPTSSGRSRPHPTSWSKGRMMMTRTTKTSTSWSWTTLSCRVPWRAALLTGRAGKEHSHSPLKSPSPTRAGCSASIISSRYWPYKTPEIMGTGPVTPDVMGAGPVTPEIMGAGPAGRFVLNCHVTQFRVRGVLWILGWVF